MMVMIVTIHQPDFLPWLGFFDRWKKSDIFIVLDDVQFIRRGWHHRDKIKTAQGIQWLTVPVVKKGHYRQLIKNVRIHTEYNWRQNLLNAIRSAYLNSPCFETIYEELEKIIDDQLVLLIDLNMLLLRYCSTKLKVRTPIIFSSDLKISAKGTDRLVKLVKSVNGSSYLTGLGSKSYLDETAFAEEGIEIIWQDYDHPIYPQLHGAFSEKLSVIDYLFMVTDPLTFFSL
jgi:hypothetical protein